MITHERFNRVLRMLEDRAQYHHDRMMGSSPHDTAAAAAMTAYNSAIIMLIEAERGHDDLLDQFDYYGKEN